MVIFNSREIERIRRRTLHHDMSVTVGTVKFAVPSFFGNTGEFDSRKQGPGEGRGCCVCSHKACASLMGPVKGLCEWLWLRQGWGEGGEINRGILSRNQ